MSAAIMWLDTEGALKGKKIACWFIKEFMVYFCIAVQ
jgi:hypothetical protein